MWERYDPPTIVTGVGDGTGRADVFVRVADCPLDVARELVQDRDRTYAINGTDSRVLPTVGAFRVALESDLERGFDGERRA